MCVPFEDVTFGGFDLLLCVLLACQVRVTVGDSGNVSITYLNYRFMCVPYEVVTFGGFDLLLCVLLACQVRVTVGDSGNVSITYLNYIGGRAF